MWHNGAAVRTIGSWNRVIDYHEFNTFCLSGSLGPAIKPFSTISKSLQQQITVMKRDNPELSVFPETNKELLSVRHLKITNANLLLLSVSVPPMRKDSWYFFKVNSA